MTLTESDATDVTLREVGGSASGDDDARMPDFLMIGTMKSGTTTLFNWLGEHPAVELPEVKEPRFLSDDDAWSRGPSWYSAVFSDVDPDARTGEASVEYTDPTLASRAARRAVRVAPNVRLLCVLRDPLERLRSHYRHEVQRGRESHPLGRAVRDPASTYVRRSRYTRALRPWLATFPRDQVCVVRFEDLFAGSPRTWHRVLRHLRLAPTPVPSGRWNATETKHRFTPLMRRLYDTGLAQALEGKVPRPMRRLARRVLLRDNAEYRSLLASSRQPLPRPVIETIVADVQHLPDLLDDTHLTWDLGLGATAGSPGSDPRASTTVRRAPPGGSRPNGAATR